ncbi:MAG: Uma2 family endonuclease [Chloroflexi bacterium]|nr:Uma2 family endonuclease [Chloroflexota bacterium]
MALPTIDSIIPYRLQMEDGEKMGALDDPGPLPEGMHQNPTLLYAALALIYRLRELPGVFVDFNTFVYYDRTDRNRRVSPDLYVALGVDADAIRERHGYLIWEVGKPPDFVLEIASEGTANYDGAGKRDLYANIGISEYWRYDSTGGDFYGFPLLGERLVDGEYQPFEVHTNEDGDIRSYSPMLDIDIYWGDDRLDVYDPDARKIIPGGYEALESHDSLEETIATLEDARAQLRAELEAREYERTEYNAVQMARENERTEYRAVRMAHEAEIARLREELRRRDSE